MFLEIQQQLFFRPPRSWKRARAGLPLAHTCLQSSAVALPALPLSLALAPPLALTSTTPTMPGGLAFEW